MGDERLAVVLNERGITDYVDPVDAAIAYIDAFEIAMFAAKLGAKVQEVGEAVSVEQRAISERRA